MRVFGVFFSFLLLSACTSQVANPSDPYENLNRKIYDFNRAVDATVLKPTAKFYQFILPLPVRSGISNAFNNIALLPSIANDILQLDWRYAIKDSWRFYINSTFGIAGFFDVADSHFGLPPHYNDMGLTFAKWGIKESSFIMIPLLGPSTIRDGIGLGLDTIFLTPYAYISEGMIIWGLAGLRTVDLRCQFFETENLMKQALDPYAFVRDAYLQHRHFRITGEQQETGELYVEGDE